MHKQKKLWEEEYLRKGIPSSYRLDPTKTLFEFLSFLRESPSKGKAALDLGCGRGRNALYLAQQGFHVTCFDMVEENIDALNQLAKDHGLPISARCHDLGTDWPVERDSFDFAIDIFCYKHLTEKSIQKHYRTSLFSALKPGGFFFLNLASDQDGFYGPLLAARADPSIKKVVDPYSGIASFLYSLEEIIGEFSDILNVIEAKKVASFSPMHGKEYTREVLSLIFQKKA